MDLRQDQLKLWAISQFKQKNQIPSIINLDHYEWQSVSGDASFRRYFRISSQGHQFILVDAPPEQEDSHPFVTIALDWKQQGINTPDVLAADYELGFMLLEDFGDDLCLKGLTPNNVDERYALCLDELSLIQKADADALPHYDQSLLDREMNLFSDWFADALLGSPMDEKTKRSFEQLKTLLVDSALAQPNVPVHRDYHSRNLLLRSADEVAKGASPVGVIDFQDAVYGPITYDLVSLLRDCYVSWPDEQVTAWLFEYADKARSGEYTGLSKHYGSIDNDTLLQYFDLMATQRHLKAIGIFARLCMRDGKATYLNDIPRVMKYVISVAKRYGEQSEWFWLLGYLGDTLLPTMIASPHFTEHQAELNQMRLAL